uniref:BTB domain-containing protein n=1 Tax=Globodera pallida TaxID=36090 RepID=A0A183BN20_GLOPA
MPAFLFLTAICFLVAAESTPGLTPENQWDVGMNYAHQTIHFLVGEGDEKEFLPAHKAILEKASGVFEKMFRFDEANAKAVAAAWTAFSEEVKPVEVTDVEVGTFKAMLAFIYADDLSRLNGDNPIAVLYAADKYNLPKLVKACLNFPIPELRNVFDALDLARFFGKEKLLCEILDRDKLINSNSSN